MSDLISKEALINGIVNTPTNSDGYNPVYLNGSATRQLEILDIISCLSTVSEQEIRNRVIEEFIHRTDKECGFYKGDNTNLSREMLLKIAEQMKEVGE